MSKDKGKKWDGKSRVSTDLYRKRYDEIFKKMTKEKAIDETVPLNENPFDIEVEEDKKINDEELKEIDDRNGF
tara:strand:- start:449 stop:667 length:219 start_codon:yes stop_codon:yes gene_type:complete